MLSINTGNPPKVPGQIWKPPVQTPDLGKCSKSGLRDGGLSFQNAVDQGRFLWAHFQREHSVLKSTQGKNGLTVSHIIRCLL